MNNHKDKKMSLKESLKKLQEQEKISVKREVKKEFNKLRKEKTKDKKCSHCMQENAKYFIKGSSEGYCKVCAKELFGELGYLEK